MAFFFPSSQLLLAYFHGLGLENFWIEQLYSSNTRRACDQPLLKADACFGSDLLRKDEPAFLIYGNYFTHTNIEIFPLVKDGGTNRSKAGD